MFGLQQEIVVTPSQHSTWQPFQGTIIERRHILYKGWWYRVVNRNPVTTTLWVPEANLRLAAAAT